jgi:hypothetical protein
MQAAAFGSVILLLAAISLEFVVSEEKQMYIFTFLNVKAEKNPKPFVGCMYRQTMS